jgi:UDP-N-acetylglucosamine 2-epimerase (non-hydrolysing)
VTERPEGIETGCVRLTGTHCDDLYSEASCLLTDETAYQKISASRNPYGDGEAARRTVQAIRFFFKIGDRPLDF